MCKHTGYQIRNGCLVCADCGEISKKAKLVNGVIIDIPYEAACPHCGKMICVESQAGAVKKLSKVATENKLDKSTVENKKR